MVTPVVLAPVTLTVSPTIPPTMLARTVGTAANGVVKVMSYVPTAERFRLNPVPAVTVPAAAIWPVTAEANAEVGTFPVWSRASPNPAEGAGATIAGDTDR